MDLKIILLIITLWFILIIEVVRFQVYKNTLKFEFKLKHRQLVIGKTKMKRLKSVIKKRYRKDYNVLGTYFPLTKKIEIYLPPFQKSKNMIKKICKTIEHEHVHYCIDKRIRQEKDFKKRTVAEHKIMEKMGVNHV